MAIIRLKGKDMASLLVVDDDAGVRAVILRALKKAGHAVRSAHSVTAALAQCLEHPIDMVIIDILMPDIDGIEGIRELRRRFPGTPLVAMSGGSARIEPFLLLDAAEVLGATAVLTKPFPMKALIRLVGELLNASPCAQPSTDEGPPSPETFASPTPGLLGAGDR
jgi:CheY-like chemotaxis protein